MKKLKVIFLVVGIYLIIGSIFAFFALKKDIEINSRNKLLVSEGRIMCSYANCELPLTSRFILGIFIYPLNIIKGNYCGYVSDDGNYYKNNCITYN